MRPRRRPVAFDPRPHERELSAILHEVARAPRLDPRTLDRIVKRHPRAGAGLFSKSEIIAGFRAFGAPGSSLSEAEFLERLRMRPVRTLSGVTPVTVLTRPFPCPGRCIFCPNDVRMPKSYLADEPGAQRAEDNRFDPYLQTWNRLAAYRGIGHPVEKVELIVLGGTWTFYPEPYQVWFAKRCLDAMNDFGRGIDRRAAAGAMPARYRALSPLDGRQENVSYNRAVSGFLAQQLGGDPLHPSERAEWEELEAAQRCNETASCRCVGLVVETRPDSVTEDEVLRIRRLGATKVQLGIQSLSDAVLTRNRRGHDVAATRRAVRLLRAAGFKIHAHWMPNLLGSGVAQDAEDFSRLFDDPDFRPDELKLYPCSLIESAELMREYQSGAWQPYDEADLAELVAECMERTPPWCRLTRVIRDFSSDDIVAGNRTTNLREVATRRLQARGGRCRDVRSREVRGEAVDPARLVLEPLGYETSVGEECFLQLVTPDGPEARLAAFLRLSLPREAPFLSELQGCALLRELHVYGASLPLGQRAGGAAQHAGLGRRLVDEAARRARKAGYRALAVISAIGTRPYYRALGFRDGGLYQQLDLRRPLPTEIDEAPASGLEERFAQDSSC